MEILREGYNKIMNKDRILITGALGFVGHNVAEYFNIVIILYLCHVAGN